MQLSCRPIPPRTLTVHRKKMSLLVKNGLDVDMPLWSVPWVQHSVNPYPNSLPPLSYFPSLSRCGFDWNREYNSVKRVYMTLAPNCQTLSWWKSQLASQLVVQKRIDKICEVESRPMERNRPDSWILDIFAYGIQNPALSNPENSSRNPESH